MRPVRRGQHPRASGRAVLPLTTVVGGGPAGSAAAIAALHAGARILIYEKSQFPRHKVCGEFISPEAAAPLTELGLWNAFATLGPARVTHYRLCFPRAEKGGRLPEPAFGVSRYALDDLLLQQAHARGATVARDSATSTTEISIVAHGRHAKTVRGRRLFGFKAHFSGPAGDAVELYFGNGFYVGVNCVEAGATNICGLGPEDALRSHAFDIDAIIDASSALRERVRPLTRTMEWLITGPLVFGNSWTEQDNCYRAGDALSFVDPFTGSGITCALITGALAGNAAATGDSVASYLRVCRKRIARPFAFSTLFRTALRDGWGEHVLPFVPGSWLVRATRPRA